MIYHYLKIAFRNLIKYKTQSIVSIVGLAIGFTCFALSALWIRYEMTYDTFHEGAAAPCFGVRSSLSGRGVRRGSVVCIRGHLRENVWFPKIC